jgi:peptide deformylase
MGNPVLRQVARELSGHEISSAETAALVADMTDTLRDYGGIGLAAPQIGVPVRLAIIEIEGGPTRYGELERMPLSVFVNPEIEVLDSDSAAYWEGCLSVPGLRGLVERPQHVKIRYTTIEGEPAEFELRGFAATVFQHEFDHLNGKLFIDRMTDMSLLSFEREYERYHSGDDLV